jgi:hypothetical protein
LLKHYREKCLVSKADVVGKTRDQLAQEES